MDAGRRASTEDLVLALCERVDEVIVAAPASAVDGFGPLGVTVLTTEPNRPFHLGNALRRMVRDTAATGLLYFGSGSGVLVNASTLDTLVAFSGHCHPGGLFNNFYSCDFAAISAADTLLSVELPARDNGLGFALSDAGFACHRLPRSVETTFDIDTPIDLLVLHASGRGGSALHRFLDGAPFDHPTLSTILDGLTDRSSLVYLYGRLHPEIWATFEQQVACRTAGAIEGRGMGAARKLRPLLISPVLLGDGPTAFLERLAAVAGAAILDTRPLLATDGRLPPTSDRFASDLFRVDEIADPAWRALTAAAAAAPIPVLLGGHSLVSGGLLLLGEAAWKGRQLDRRLHPDPYPGRNDRP